MKQKQNTIHHDRFISDKGLLFNLIFIDAICLVFGIINLFSNIVIGAVTLGFGAVTTALYFMMKAKRVSKSAVSCAEAAGAVSDEVRTLNELVGTK